MGLTALEIYKHLPKKNCTECGVPTCLAFAMQLASLKAKLEACPYVTEQAKAALKYCVNRLNEGDRFALIEFDNAVRKLSTSWRSAR